MFQHIDIWGRCQAAEARPVHTLLRRSVAEWVRTLDSSRWVYDGAAGRLGTEIDRSPAPPVKIEVYRKQLVGHPLDRLQAPAYCQERFVNVLLGEVDVIEWQVFEEGEGFLCSPEGDGPDSIVGVERVGQKLGEGASFLVHPGAFHTVTAASEYAVIISELRGETLLPARRLVQQRYAHTPLYAPPLSEAALRTTLLVAADYLDEMPEEVDREVRV